MSCSDSHPFEQLMRVVGVHGYGQATDVDRREVRRRLDRYLAGDDSQSLEGVFDLHPRGPLSALQAWQHDRRVRQIRDLANVLHDGAASRRQLALEVHRDLRDYERTLWPSDRRRGGPHHKTPAAYLRFAILSTGLPLPENEKTIRRAISDT